MSARSQEPVIRRWSGGQHASKSAVAKILESEGLRPFTWDNPPNFVYPVRTHGYVKTLVVLSGTLEVSFPDLNIAHRLGQGDRIDIPSGLRHGVTVGKRGVGCMEANRTERDNRKPDSGRRTQELPVVEPPKRR